MTVARTLAVIVVRSLDGSSGLSKSDPRAGVKKVAGGIFPSARRREASASLHSHPCLFDHLVGHDEDGLWDGEVECLRGLQVDDQMEPRGLLDGEVGGLGSL